MSKLVILLGTSCFGAAFGHPVSYEGALSVMWASQPGMVDFQTVYSLTNRYALGIDYVHDSMGQGDQQYVIPRFNFLLKRWNGEDYQANIYLSAGYGVAQKTGAVRQAIYGAVESDFETRRVYFSGKASTIKAGGFRDSTLYQLRAGIAPYLAEFDGFHTWGILQAQYFPTATDQNWRVGPMLRFFYRNVLWEIGVTTQSSWNFNAMIHF